MRAVLIVARVLGAITALGCGVAIGFGIDSLIHVDVLKGCGSPNFSVDNCPPDLIVSYHIDSRVPHDTLPYYVATLVMLVVVIGLIGLLRNVVGAGIAAGLTFIAGLVFLFGQFWYIDIEPGFFAAGTWIADVLGFATWAIVTVLLVLEVVAQGRRRPHTIPPQLRATASRT